MAPSGVSRVRARREALGLSQIALAVDAQLSRQSLGAIESGRAVPSVDIALRLARRLACRVEDLFGAAATPATLRAETCGRANPGRVALARAGGRWLAYPLRASEMRTSADGVAVRAQKASVEVEPLRPLSELAENVVLMGCAPALGVLADRLNGRASGRFLWFSSSSTAALEALRQQQTHVAGVHLVDARTGSVNVADVRRHAGVEAILLVTLGGWEAGWVTAAGNPKRIRRSADLARRGLRLVSRELGSGARRLFDQELRAAGVTPNAARHASVQASGHLEVAQAVAIGAADAGMATRDAALAFGLDFVTVAEERYDLALPLALADDPRIVRLLDTLTSAPLRRELSSLGYDVRASGDRVVEVRGP